MKQVNLPVAAASLLLTLPLPALAGSDYPGKLPDTVVPRAYAIDLTPDLTALTLTAGEVVDVDMRAPTDTITLNLARLTIDSARVDGVAGTVGVDEERQTATITLPSAVPAGPHRLTIAYHGPIPATPNGLYYADYTTKDGNRRMLVTQFEPADARRMFPGWDEPAFKATYTLSVRVPAGMQALSNMPAAADTPEGDGRRVTFATTPRMSSYLLALAVGDLAAVRDRAGATDIAVWTPAGQEDTGRYALGAEAALLPFYNEYFGTPYPLPKLDLIAVPGNFDAGAMENWGAITFIDNALLFDPSSSAPLTREEIHFVVSHEMAHQWSGDLVTMRWWDDLWLNEAFANWMDIKATDHFNPDWQVWPREHRARERAMAIDARPTTHAIHQPINDESEALTAFDAITYEKGDQVIRMIEDWIGADAFRDGMRAYMHDHAYGNATSADLWRALEGSSGQPVGRVASTFTEQPGIPLVHVATRCDANETEVTLTQERFTIHDPAPAALNWEIPVVLGAPGAAPQKLLLGDAPATVRLPGCGAPVKANLGEGGYYRTVYDAAALAPLVEVFTKLSASDRANVLGDQYALFAADRAPLDAYLTLLGRLGDERSIAVWNDTIAHLTELDRLAAEAPERAAFRRFARGVLAPAYARLGWDRKPNESVLDTLLRPDVLTALARFDDDAVAAEAGRRFAAFRGDPASLDPGLREAVLRIVGQNADRPTYDALRGMLRDAVTTEDKERLFAALASARDPALTEATIGMLTSDRIPPAFIDRIIYAASVYGDDPGAVWRAVLPLSGSLRARMTESARNELLPAAAMQSADPTVAAELLADTSDASAGARIAAARVADAVNTRAELRARALPALGVWLHDHGGA